MYKILNQLKLNQRGVSAIMALLILSLILVSVLALTKVMMSEVRVSLNAQNVIASSYVAESGIEKSLYYIKYSRQQGDFDYYTNLEGQEQTMFNGGKFTIQTASLGNTYLRFFNVTTSSPAHLDIIDPAGDVSSIAWSTLSPTAAFSTTWEIEDCYPEHASDRMEVTIYSFGAGYLDPSGAVASPDVTKGIYVCNCAYAELGTSAYCMGGIGGNLSTSRYYRFVFRPLDSTVKKINFGLNNRGIYSQALIKVDGLYHSSQYRWSASLPALSPTSDIFSYVIFSEEELSK